MTTPAWATYDVLEWGEVPGTYQGGSAADLTPGTDGITKRLSYSGFALFGTKIYLPRNGGHTDYPGSGGNGGNEVVVIDLGADSPTWSLDCAPSTDSYDGNAYFADGTPEPAHQYWGSIYSAVMGGILQLYTSYTGAAGNSYPASNFYNTTTKAFAAAGTVADAPGRFTTLDTSTGKLWGATADDLHCYDPSNNTYSTVHSPGVGLAQPIVYDPSHDDFVTFAWGDGEASGSGTTFFKTDKSGTQTACTVNASAAYTEWEAIAAFYHAVIKDPDNDRWFVFSPSGNGTPQTKVYTLTPASGNTYDMAILAVTGVSLPPCVSSGVSNRFQYVAGLGGIVYMPRATSNVLFLRLSGTPAPGRTSPDPDLKILIPLTDSTPIEIVSSATVTAAGSAAYDASAPGPAWTFGSGSGDGLNINSIPVPTLPFTIGGFIYQASGTGSNAGIVGIELDSGAKNYALFLDTNHDANCWSRDLSGALGESTNTNSGFASGEWMMYAAVYHADGSRTVYDSRSGFGSTDSTAVDMSGSAAELYVGSYPRNDYPWNVGAGMTYVFYFDVDKDKASLDQIAANPASLLIEAIPPVTGTGASTQSAQTSASIGAVSVSGAGATTQAPQTDAASGSVSIAGASSSAQAAQISAGAGAVALAGTSSSTQGAQVCAAVGAVSVSGALASAEASQTSAGAGAVEIDGAGASTQGVQISAGSGFVADPGASTGTAASSQAPQVGAGAGAVSTSGAGASTQSLQTTSAAGAVATSGAAASVQAPQVSAGSGDVEDAGASVGSAASIQGLQFCAAAGAVAISGAAESTQRPQVSAGRGGNGTDPQIVPLSVPQAIFAALRSLVADRVYPNEFPQGDPLPTWPAIRYTIVIGDPSPTVDGSGDEDTDDVIVYIDVVAKTYPAMRALKAQVITALQSTDPPCSRDGGGQEGPDGETRTHRVVMTYRFQQSSAS